MSEMNLSAALLWEKSNSARIAKTWEKLQSIIQAAANQGKYEVAIHWTEFQDTSGEEIFKMVGDCLFKKHQTEYGTYYLISWKHGANLVEKKNG